MNTVVNYTAKKVVGNVAERVHKNQASFETDPEVIAAAEEVLSKQKRHWYNKKIKATPDLILTQEERHILTKVKSRAWYLDKGFHCCCFDIGLDGLIGLIPGVGDVITTYMALQLVRTAAKANLPKSVISQMVGNVFLDFVVGLTPIAGDILDVLFKCNWRNALLFEEFLIKRRMEEIRSEKGAYVTLNDDHTVTTQVGALHGESSGHPPPIHKKGDQATHHEHLPEEEEGKKKNKYGTFFTWKS